MAVWMDMARRSDPPGASRSLDVLELSVRAHGALRSQGCVTLADVAAMTEADILRIPNCGRLSLAEINEALWSYGLRLRKPPNRLARGAG